MQAESRFSRWELHGRLTVQVTGSYLLVSGTGLIVFHLLGMTGLVPALVILLTLICSVGIGFLAMFNLQHGIVLLHQALLRLAEGQSVEVQPFNRCWPLIPLFRSLIPIGQKMDTLGQREQLAQEYREQLLQQASDAAVTKERTHLARELHDSIKQQLFSIRWSAIAAKAQVQSDITKAREAIEDIQRCAEEAQVEMQALLQQLRSVVLEHTTLIEAVHTQAQALEYRSGTQVSVAITDLPALDRFPLPMQEAVFRIIQEAFVNIARHSRAVRVDCTIVGDEKDLRVVIQDDGQGFDIQSVQKGMGLVNIQERASHLNGEAEIESTKGVGTIIRVRIPLLLLPEVRLRNEQQELEAQKMVEMVQGGLHLRSIMGSFTLVLLALDLALFTTNAPAQLKELSGLILGFCLLLMLYGLVSAHLALERLALYHNQEDRPIRLYHFQEHRGWINFWRLSLLASWHVVYWGLSRAYGATWWQIGICFLVSVALILTAHLFGYRWLARARKRYYMLLPGKVLAVELRLRWRELRLRILLSLCLGIPIFVPGILTLSLHILVWHWFIYYTLFILVVLGIGIIIDVRQHHFWEKQCS